jgi:hypothetical protein
MQGKVYHDGVGLDGSHVGGSELSLPRSGQSSGEPQSSLIGVWAINFGLVLLGLQIHEQRHSACTNLYSAPLTLMATKGGNAQPGVDLIKFDSDIIIQRMW